VNGTDQTTTPNKGACHDVLMVIARTATLVQLTLLPASRWQHHGFMSWDVVFHHVVHDGINPSAYLLVALDKSFYVGYAVDIYFSQLRLLIKQVDTPALNIKEFSSSIHKEQPEFLLTTSFSYLLN